MLTYVSFAAREHRKPCICFEVRLLSQQRHTTTELSREEMGDYVADLQLHMTLQARKLVPDLNTTGDSRTQLLQDTQAEAEKYVSRQSSV